MIARLVALLMLAVCVLASVDEDARATSFFPEISAGLSDPTPGATATITTTFSLSQPDAMFETHVTFIPTEFGVPLGSDIADGAVVGELNAILTLGLIGSPCSQLLEPQWDLLDASTNIAQTVSFEDLDGDFTPDYVEDEDLDELFDSVTSYPEPLTRIFPGMTPRARILALEPIAGIPYLISILTFEPGTDVFGLPIDPSLGYPVATVILDHGDPQSTPEPSAITDLCSPLIMQAAVSGVTLDNPETAGDEGGQTYRTNPAAGGAYPIGMVVGSLPDADNDGLENALDVCPFDVNVGSPRVYYSGDADGDGLDAACDPNDDPGLGTNSDEDSDGYLNRQDNCPLAANGQLQTNQIDTDLDGIGDNCDATPNVVSGHAHKICSTDIVVVGGGGPPPSPLPLPCDTDNDGVLDGDDNCPTVANAAGQGADADGDLAGDACDGPGSGNVDCTLSVNAIDALKVLRHSAGLTVAQNEPCLDIGEARLLAPPDDWQVGDVNCSGGVNSVDALFILRANAGIPWLIPPVGCPEIKPA